MFPRWLLQKALSLNLSWKSVTGVGASLHIEIPRIIPRSHAGWTAIRSRNIEHLQNLISSKALFPTDIDDSGQSLLLYSFRQWPPSIFKFMLELSPASVFSWKDCSRRSVVSHLYRNLALGNLSADSPIFREVEELATEDYTSTTIVDVVAKRTDFDISLQNAIDINPGSINTCDTAGLTPVHWAVIKKNRGSLGILIHNGVNLNVADYEGWMPLHHAASVGDTSVARLLVEAGSNVNAVSSWGDTPLHLATRGYYCDVVELLLSSGASVEVENLHKRTAFFMPFRPFPSRKDSALLPTLEALERAGGSISRRDNKELTPLHLAVIQNHALGIRALYQLKANFEVRDLWDHTILHLAGLWGTLDTINALRQLEICTVDPDVLDKSGCTALDLFERRLEQPLIALNADQFKPVGEEIEAFYSLIKEVRGKYHSSQLVGESFLPS
ncbi:MAG: hypothetical protein M1833_006839 [Piccolia ochrophora]|nr:MAG: hypothetical protein M1833_006839 [Piccolia ochrophora]